MNTLWLGGGLMLASALIGVRVWRRGQPATSARSQGGSAPPAAAPSSFYQARVWQFGLWLARVIPKPVFNGLCVAVFQSYARLRPERVRVVTDNLLPIFNGERGAAERAARSMFRQFALKLADLLRLEGGEAISEWKLNPKDWDALRAVVAKGRGVLLLTPHLGNWEVGAPLLSLEGFQLAVLTQAEPGSNLTELRKGSRSRWGVETIVVGNDAFAFVEIIKRLQAGAIVAMLVDRPVGANIEAVDFFGRPYRAALAPAELARASGCALLPVVIIREGDRYRVHVYPELEYDRRALGNREARRTLTQRIMHTFEPEIRQYPDQWYHFVPVWPAAEPAPTGSAPIKPAAPPIQPPPTPGQSP
ncbi:MAG: lysophospholipid acyltransferase family protein [Verrucomicrobiota bacterium]